MTRMALFILCVFISQTAIGQSPDALNMTSNCRWDNDNLPSRSGAYFNDIWGYADNQGNEVAIVGGIQDIFFINVHNCTLIDSIHIFNDGTTTVNHSLWRDFKTYQHYAYAVADEGFSGLIIFDLSNIPNSVSQVYQSTSFFDETHNIFIDEVNARLYVAGSDTRGNGLIVLDIGGSNATNPAFLSSVSLANSGGYVHDVFVKDNIAYASHGGNGLTVYNFADPVNPIVMGMYNQYPEQGYNHSSWVNDDNTYLVFADETFGKSVKRVAITLDVPNNTITFGNLDLFKSQLESTGNSIAHNPFIKGEMVYISYYHDGVQVFDISQPDTVTRHAYYDTEPSNTDYSSWDGAWGAYPYLPSGKIIASDQLNGFYSVEMIDEILAHESLEFNINHKERGFDLYWEAISNRSNARFNVAHQFQASGFQQIGQLDFKSEEDSYTLSHQPSQLYGRHTYKIDFINETGKVIATRFKYIDIDAPDQFQIIGNTSSDIIRLEGPSFSKEQSISVFHMDGKLANNYKWFANTSEMDMNISNLPAGIYTVQWSDGVQNWVERISVAR